VNEAARHGLSLPRVESPIPQKPGPWLAALALAWFNLAGPAAAQEPGGTPAPSAPAPERPGLFRLGPFYLTPYLYIGTMGIDTNVFYTASERQADFTASGGPGLELVWPLGSQSRLTLDGGLDYLYFLRTESQRRLNGFGTALLDLRGVKTSLLADERYLQTFSRPSFEVDTRVQQEREGTRAQVERRLGERLSLVLLGSRQRTRTDEQSYLGTDLGATLTQDEYRAGGELERALTVKTSFVVGGDQSWYRFPELPVRNGSSTRVWGGFRTGEAALISGRALGGYRWFRLDEGPRQERGLVVAQVDVTLNLSPKTKLGSSFVRDLSYSAFATIGGTPTLLNESIEVFFDKVLARNVYFRIFARQVRVISDGDEVLVLPDEGLTVAKRNDRVREVGAELGYQFRSRVRAGVTATYTTRDSSIETFGIEGLLAGFTLQYTPPQPVFR